MNHLSESEFQSLQDRARDGRIAVAIPRNVARQFFIRVSGRDVVQAAGVDITFRRLVVWTGLVLAPLTLIACCVAIVNGFGFTAALIVPLVGAFWAVVTGLTYQHGSWFPVSAVLAVAVVTVILIPNDYTIPVLLFCASAWMHRMTFIAAQRYLQSLVVDSYEIYDRLADHVELEELPQRG